MIRISSGTAKNIHLKSPDISQFRGVQEVAKQAVFHILNEKVKDALCLDLYAGSGNMGLEALSRGAKFCDFVDNDKRAVEAIKQNVRKCSFEDKSEVISSDAVKYVSNTPEKYDVIFVDPYYDNISQVHLVRNLSEILNIDGLIVFFHGQELDWDKTLKESDLKEIDRRKFGKSFFTILAL